MGGKTFDANCANFRELYEAKEENKIQETSPK